MLEIHAFPHFSLSGSRTLITAKCVILEVPAFLCLPMDPTVYIMRGSLLPAPPPPPPLFLVGPSCLPAVTDALGLNQLFLRKFNT